MEVVSLNDVGLLRIGNELSYSGFILGNGNEAYIVPLPEESKSLQELELRLIDLDDSGFEAIIRQTDLMETEIFDKNQKAKILVRKSQRQLDAIVSWKVFKRDGYACRYCGADNVPLTYDHILLWEDGGPNTELNGISACKKCNKTRGNQKFDEWLRSSYYLKVSKNLTPEGLTKNEKMCIIYRSGEIEAAKNKRSR